jgi:two-component system response regulator
MAPTVEVNVRHKEAMAVESGIILLVDDDAKFAELTRTILLEGEEVTDEVVLARDGVEAIEYLFHPKRAATQMPSLVLLDLSMPRMDGFRVLSKLRAAEQTMFIPVVILSSSVHPEDVRSAYGLGANGYLNKLSDEVPWHEMIRATARYWLGMNITPNSFVGQKDWISQARMSSSYGGEHWRRTPDLAKLADLPRDEAIRVATLIYGWSAAEAAERVDTEQGRYTEGRNEQQAPSLIDEPGSSLEVDAP